MEFIWIDYCTACENEVEALFDSDAVKFTGCDDGFKAFYDYWLGEIGTDSFFCKVIISEEHLMGVIALARAQDGVFTIQEFVVSPEHRGKGLGTMMLKEFLQHSMDIMGQEITVAKAVIYPDNLASQKAFSKAGFVHTLTHPDGDAMYYQYKKC